MSKDNSVISLSLQRTNVELQPQVVRTSGNIGGGARVSGYGGGAYSFGLRHTIIAERKEAIKGPQLGLPFL
ncbi:hypothetical protein FA13DRAFT_1733320 [Coprinellus micaceus]|uniref:Uncharacterized protein n=1 Tax=Coprinellus micaceus TaxID=71717 RepID=A0A4Y7T9R3_COPMI|nr:hypothetical protein FA13DRAFT_1733320 [Coprinellus micaceus]